MKTANKLQFYDKNYSKMLPTLVHKKLISVCKIKVIPPETVRRVLTTATQP